MLRKLCLVKMVWFRENWYEEVLRQLRAGLAKCHVVAFHHRAAVADATVTPHTLNFVKKVVSTFGISIGISESQPRLHSVPFTAC